MQANVIRSLLEYLFSLHKDQRDASEELDYYLRDYGYGKRIDEDSLTSLLQEVGHLFHYSITRTLAPVEEILDVSANYDYPMVFIDRDGLSLHWIKRRGTGYEWRTYSPNSPESSRQISQIPFDEFLERDGKIVVFLFAPQDDLFADPDDFKELSDAERPLRRFIRLFRPERSEIILLYLYALFNGLVTLSLPLGIQAIILFLMGAQLSTSLIVLIGLVLFGILVSGGLQIMQIWIVEAMQQRLFARASFEFAHRIPRFRMDSIRGLYAPELANRFFDILSVQKGVPKILIDMSTALLQIFFGLILLAFYHPVFLIIGAFLMLLLYVGIRMTSPRAMIASLSESKYKYKVAYWLEELGRSLRIFKMAGSTNLPIERTDQLVTHYLYYRRKKFRVLITQNWFLVLFKLLLTAAMLILGGTLVADNQINIGQFVAAEIVIVLILGSIEKIISNLESVYDVLTATEKLGNVTDVELERQHGIRCQDLDIHKGLELTIKDLTYTSPTDGKPILRGVSMQINPGEKIALVGANGSGKSTFLSLLTGILEFKGGSILIQGIPLRNLDLHSLHSLISDNLSQDLIFHGSVYENLTVGKLHINFDQVTNAVRRVGLEPFVQSLPKGYETILSPGDATIPSGELKKLTLARCLAENPKLLLMEDLFGVYRGEHKKKILNAVLEELPDCTVIAASNDSELLQRVDRIFIFEEGKVVAKGTFEQLKDDGTYNYLFK
jgi:ABC-type bacteriocin/lantibiotic exporter with double-glycine peptidase domain